jgi:8-oxo-dGTP diphosphatase
LVEAILPAVFWQPGPVRNSVRVVHDLVAGIPPGDSLEAEHRAFTLSWLQRTDDVFRQIKPATPDPHLVSYCVLVDPANGSSLLVDHVLAGLWLPAGGHVDPDEHPADTAAREAAEELGIEPVFADPTRRPAFISVTRTTPDPGHLDVSLWFVLVGRRGMVLTPDQREFTEARWWSPAEVGGGRADRFDPNYRRFAAKLAAGPVSGSVQQGAPAAR